MALKGISTWQLCMIMLFLQGAILPATTIANTFKITTPDIITVVPRVENKLLKSYQKVGIKAELIRLPARRSLETAKESDWVDAELARSEQLGSILVDYIRIPTPLLTLSVNSYSQKANQCFPNWKSLKSSQVAILRGFLSIKARLVEHNIKYLEVTSNAQAVAMLKANRVDAIITPEFLLTDTLKARLQNSALHCMKVIEAVPLYHYIRKRHQAIVTQLKEVIKEAFKDEP
ncbi:transporter substrate-binding domain-containing protein [Colwellia sp. 1_MG-2023]|uniref:transporter substrate-binding domain-containing protein n=1 Tax=Colwellia sp. 1_MG-2023 TaxID=3062649 RepID=UPI0026E2AAD8|nr:transporter substrate-binding domain-containing protein [Colwellia sp. 1_MG-2023]MDO6444857.1 transporter substrate-binding domain-containing protein [Colwellia sp. 1_MG-2023]